jgi:hypothetical protein
MAVVAEPPAAHASAEAQHSPPPPTSESHDPKQDHGEEPVAVEPAAEAENPHQPVADPEPHQENIESKQGPNLAKALIIFLLINGAFALLGGAAFFVYRMKKKKVASGGTESEQADDAEPEDEKRAA